MPLNRDFRSLPTVAVPIAASFLAAAAPALAASGRAPDLAVPDWVTVASLALPFVLAWVRRGKPVGGWLFVYLWEGIARALLAVGAGVAANWDRFGAAAWHGDVRRHAAFLVAVVPPILLAALETAAAVLALRTSSRSAQALRRLRTILGLEVGTGLVSVALDSLYWPQNLVFSAPSLLWPVAWSAYFHASKRVASVFRAAE